MNWYRIGSYIWTASSAGWLVLFLLTQTAEAFVLSFGCAVGALVWGTFNDDMA